MMGLDNPIHILFLLILLLLVFGAKRLPEMGRSLGSGMRGFKDSLNGEGTQTRSTAQQPRSDRCRAPAAPLPRQHPRRAGRAAGRCSATSAPRARPDERAHGHRRREHRV